MWKNAGECYSGGALRFILKNTTLSQEFIGTLRSFQGEGP